MFFRVKTFKKNSVQGTQLTTKTDFFTHCENSLWRLEKNISADLNYHNNGLAFVLELPFQSGFNTKRSFEGVIKYGQCYHMVGNGHSTVNITNSLIRQQTLGHHLGQLALKGRSTFPNQMNFRKSSKQPLTPPPPPLIFGKLHCKFFKLATKPWSKSPV